MKTRPILSTRTSTRVLVSGLLLMAISWLYSPATQAEVPLRNSAQLVKDAELTINGKVRNIKRRRSANGEGTVYRNYAITVNVNETEKGTIAENKKSIVVRGYTVIKQARGVIGGSGHFRTQDRQRLSVLRSGSRVRLYLTAKEDGTYDILLPNGFEPLR